ncbi:MAG: YSC84-related protein [Nitrospirae bacterium]|nr:YSC84-related protein [Nitrospirota bacterium]
MLVFPAVYRAGLIGGAEYGDGVLRIAGKTVGYDNFAGLSFGPQIGVQKTSLLLMFMKEPVLDKFQASQGFELGIDANATGVVVGANASLDTTNAGESILAFIFGQRGLMAGVTLEGSKFTKRDHQ